MKIEFFHEDIVGLPYHVDVRRSGAGPWQGIERHKPPVKTESAATGLLDIMPYGGGNWAAIQWEAPDSNGKHPFRVVSIENTRNKANKKVMAIIAKQELPS